MRKNKNLILNSKINEVISSLGHFQKLVICDSGLPIPIDAYLIDISLTRNIPSFIDVFNAIVKELDIEKIFLASEIQTENKKIYGEINLLKSEEKFEIKFVSHEELKLLSNDAYCFIKTGETSVYANCIIEAGVCFNDLDNDLKRN